MGFKSFLWSSTRLGAVLTKRQSPGRYLATAVSEGPRTPQTLIEKVVQKYAVGLAPQRVVRAGDYVMIRPQHVMTHDNTGPVISKYVGPTRLALSHSFTFADLQALVQRRYPNLHNRSSHLTTMCKTNRQRIWPSTRPSRLSRASIE